MRTDQQPDTVVVVTHFGLGHFVFFSGVGSAFSVGSKWEPSRRYISVAMNAASNPDLLRKIMVSRLGP